MEVVFKKHVSGLTLIILAGLLLLVSGEVFAAGGRADYDLDDDGLIEINDLADLNEVRNDLAGTSLYGDATGCPSGGCFGYELTTDLDFDTNSDEVLDADDDYWNSGGGWQPISTFTGTFDGNGFEIRNLMINHPNWTEVGLFGEVNNATIRNLGLTGELTSVTGFYDVAILAGMADWTLISNCFTAGVTNSIDTSGGIVGWLDGNSTVSGSFSTTTVTCSPDFGVICGGLVGYSLFSTIDNSFATGKVSGDEYTGGLIGSFNVSELTNSYATGLVTNSKPGGLIAETFDAVVAVTASYWDTETSGQASSADGEALGLTTAEMQCPTSPDDTGCKAGTTLYEGWDPAIWDFGTGSQYPALIINGKVYRDSDGDGIWNYEDSFPYDYDNDGYTDADETAAGTDITDADDVPADTDGDFISDATDTDIDGDGVENASDAFPYDASETTDTDGDSVGDNSDTDIDGDGLSNEDEVNVYGTDPMVSDADADTDGDGISNVDEVDTYGTDPRVADTPSDSVVSGSNNNGGGCFIQMLFE